MAAPAAPPQPLAGHPEPAVYHTLIAGTLSDADDAAVARAYWMASRLLPAAPALGSAYATAARFALQRANAAPTEALRKACESLCVRHRLVADMFLLDDEGPAA